MSMPTIDECKAYTEAFRTLRLEHSISMLIGIILGAWAMWLHRR